MGPQYPEDPRAYLNEEYERRRARRPHYSLRAFARDLELGASTLTEFLKARQGLSRERAVAIATKLRLTIDQQAHFLDLIAARYERRKSAREEAAVRIRSRNRQGPSHVPKDLFKVLSDWTHFAWLELLEIDESYAAPRRAAKALGVSERVAQATWARLLRTGMVVERDGRFRPNEEMSFGGDEGADEVVRAYHGKLLKRALQALEQPVDQREFASVVFSLRRKDLPSLKSELSQAFLKVLGKYAGADPRDAVYCGAFQLFDLLAK